jgi:hypothetical protein
VFAARDLDAWRLPVHVHKDLAEARIQGLAADGIHQIGLANDLSLDVCMQDIGKLGAHGARRAILIGLSGAVANRQGKKAPFFSGLAMARTLDLPIVAVSDPTLNLDPDVPLCWYAGNHMAPRLPEQIAEVLELVAERHGAELLLFGGSGGGYAALTLATLLRCRAAVLVWNPQTDIADYVPEFVVQYIQAAFPAFAHEAKDVLGQPRGSQARALSSLLGRAGVRNDLRSAELLSGVRVLYLQNQSDWHVRQHALPYFANKSWRRVGHAAFARADKENLAAYIGNWGEGHAPPPKEMLGAVLARMAAGETSVDLAKALDGGLDGRIAIASRFHWPGEPLRLKVEARALHEKGVVQAACEVLDEAPVESLTYAFYLVLDGQRCDMRWYERSRCIEFPLPRAAGRLEVVAFVRARTGDQFSARTEVIRECDDQLEVRG